MLYIFLFIVSFGVSTLVIPVLRRSAFRYNMMIDFPNERKLHLTPTPCNGGLAIALAFLAAIAVAVAMRRDIQQGNELRHLMGIVLGGVFIVSLGTLDDIRGLNAYEKLLGQIIAAFILVLFGTRIRSIDVLLWHVVDLPLGVSVFITVFWVLVAINAFNLIDGMDGLAGGIALIASTALCLYAVFNGKTLAVIITISLMGSCLGFLRHNYPPAKVFMGDCGSMFLGFVLASISIQSLYRSSATSLLIPTTILAIPLADTFLAIVRRFSNRKSPFHADRGHIHHRLLDLGLSPKLSILLLYGLCVILGIIALVASIANEKTAFISIAVTGGILVSILALISHYANKMANKKKRWWKYSV